MSDWQWGSVPGDANASAIMMDRQSLGKSRHWASQLLGLATIGLAIWYGAGGGAPALAALIVFAAWEVIAAASADLHGTHTFTMITERRVQLVEQQLQAMQLDLNNGRYAPAPPARRPASDY